MRLRFRLLAVAVGLSTLAGMAAASGYERSHGQELRAPDAANGDYVGWSVAIDGDVLVVGAHGNSGSGWNRGAVHVFERDPSTGLWSHVQELTDPNAADEDLFGWSVAIHGDTIVAGANWDAGAGIFRGAVHVFERDPSTGLWSHVQELTDPKPADSDEFGRSVATDGNIIVAGAPFDDGAAAGGGAVHVFLPDPKTGEWVHTQELTDPNAADNGHFGWSVAIGGTAIVAGAPGSDVSIPKRGAVHVFLPDPKTGEWVHTQELTDPNATDGDALGRSVAIDGTVIVAGAPDDDGAGTDRGAVHVFVRERLTGEWAHAGELTDPRAADGDELGRSVAIDGTAIVAGAPYDDGAGTDRGAVHVFGREADPGKSKHIQELRTPDPADGDLLGRSVGIAGDTVAAGAPFDDETGSVHVFGDTTDPTVEITVPADGTEFQLGAPVTADYSCSDGAGSGIDSCIGPVPDGAAIPTGSLGTFNFTVVATDRVGNTSTVTHAYEVVARCDGKAVTLFVPPGGGLFEGTGGDDVILGTDGPDWISGKGGDDTICGLGGDDLLLGGPGNDTVLGGDGNDKLRGAGGDDTLRGEGGSDRMLPEAGNDLINGGPGSDIVDYLAADGPVDVNLPAGTATYSPVGGPAWTHTLVLVEKVDGSPFDDILIGDAKRNVLRGKHGIDTISGGDGDDDLIGGLDDDQVQGGPGADLLKGQGGDDSLLGGDGPDRLVGGSGNDTLSGGAGDDTLIGGLKSHLGTFVNTLDGGAGTDTCRWDTPTTNCP